MSVKIKIYGMVQGIGFRPYVYNKAIENNISGYICNCPDGVEIAADLSYNDGCTFLNSIISNCFEGAFVKNTEIIETDEKYSGFEIRQSTTIKEKDIYISPDLALCDNCKKDIKDKKGKRYMYPLTSCSECGPRFSCIKKVPYDRSNTTFEEFHMCDSCHSEYTNYRDRRYHAQTICCDKCGPEIYIKYSDGKIDSSADVFNKAANMIAEGKVAAIKSIGGYNLVCDAKNRDAVAR